MGPNSANVTKIDIQEPSLWRRISEAVFRPRTVTTEVQAKGYGVRIRLKRTTVYEAEKPQ
jgi:hypothetical protein